MKFTTPLYRLAGLMAAIATSSFVGASSLRAQSPLEADAAAFRLDSTHAQVEIYYGVLERALAFSQSGGSYVAAVKARAEVWQEGKAIAGADIRDTERCQCTAAELEARGANKLLSIASFSVPYGHPTTAAFIWQRGDGPGKSDTIAIPVALPAAASKQLALSGVELASGMSKAGEQASPFDKAGFTLNPNPSAVFGENYTKLYYYAELYVPQALIGSDEAAEVVTRVLDATGKEVLTSSQKVALKGAAMPVLSEIDLDGVAEDSYKLELRVKYEDAVQVELQKPFFYSTGIKLSEEAPSATTEAKPAVNEEVLFASSAFSRLADGEADERIAQSMYLGTEADRKLAKTMKTTADKQHFLFTFWRQRDALEHATQPLTAYGSFEKRLAEVTKQYSYQKTPGWKTGRGRIYLMYGQPQSIDNEQFVSGAKPYIIWEYDQNTSIQLTSGAKPQFVFVDRQGGGNYYLVHSNVQGETSQPDWYNREALRLSH